jgi:hypothetical protein
MSDTAHKLAVGATIVEGISIGTRNIGPILMNVLLWIITIWIPYINVGTTIGLMAGIVSKASRGETIPIAEIFDPKYRKYMGEFFLASCLIVGGVAIGVFFLFIPGVVIGIAWSLALLLVVDKGKNPTEAITLSNNCTYGYKARIFGIYFLVCLLFCIALMIVVVIGSAIVVGIGYPDSDAVAFFPIIFLAILFMVFAVFVFIGLQASIYKQLTEGV